MYMPYIPKAHEKYNLLPFCREDSGEVFSYSSEMENAIQKLLPERETVIPYGFDSYEAFNARIDEYIIRFGTENDKLNQLGQLLVDYKADIKRRNIKEDWSIAKYVGKSTKGVFTHGRCYYWPCSIEEPEYEGIIDDEEFTSYLAWGNEDEISTTLDDGQLTDSIEYCGDWAILEDPTGMATRHLGGE
ncbi:MAG: hypothetical protein LBU67_04395 [Oscillospiraceae bacterium]|jgi:hypothetical protein|nr:hypothetical protein [Oscillospiraceae bacterium]